MEDKIIDIARFQDKDNSILGISKCLDAAAVSETVIDLSGCRWMQIGEVVTLASYFRASRAKGLGIAGRYVPSNDVGAYLTRMDFFKAQDIVKQEHFKRHDSKGRFLTLTLIKHDVNANDIPARLRDIVLSKTAVDRSLVDALDYAFGEIIDNVLMHSRSSVEGLVGAQYYPAKLFVEFCVADGGIGVANTLRSNPIYSALDDLELLVKSFEHGVGENTEDFSDDGVGYGCGFGLTFAARLVEATGGDLWMVSNSAGVHLCKGGIEAFNGYNAMGTAICMRIPSDVHVSENDVLRNGVMSPYGWDPVAESFGGFDDALW